LRFLKKTNKPANATAAAAPAAKITGKLSQDGVAPSLNVVVWEATVKLVAFDSPK
jgi:hypothetical protein